MSNYNNNEVYSGKRPSEYNNNRDDNVDYKQGKYSNLQLFGH